MTATAGPVLARFARPRTDNRTRLGVVADVHVPVDAEGTWKVFHRAGDRLRTAVRAMNDAAVDATVLLGDLTKDGHPDEFDRVAGRLADLDAPWVAVPGNHDVPKRWDDYDCPPVESFAARFGPGSLPGRSDPGDLPFHVEVGGVDVLGVDSADADGRLRDSHEGRVTEATRSWLRATLPGVETPVVALHHNLTHARRHTGPFPDADFHRVNGAPSLRSLLADHDVPLVLSGHLHWPATAAVDGVRELLAPATCSFPQAALVLDVGPDGTVVRMVPLADGTGTAEAYVRAAAGNAHGQGVAAYADRGVLSTLPFVDATDNDAGAPGDAAVGSAATGSTPPARVARGGPAGGTGGTEPEADPDGAGGTDPADSDRDAGAPPTGTGEASDVPQSLRWR
jgi:predicted phosphodiesterase